MSEHEHTHIHTAKEHKKYTSVHFSLAAVYASSLYTFCRRTVAINEIFTQLEFS
jgi:hypothetical protein